MSDSHNTMQDDGLDPHTSSMFGDENPNASFQSGKEGAYQVLARKYRPTTFDDMVGQEAMVRTLTNAFKTGRIAHAFMLTGVRGVGKTTTARLLARALNYVSDKEDGPSIRLDPPGRNCQSIMESRHPDVLELDAASRTGVADMRELLDGVRYSPVNARYKVYIIDEVHMLSTAAFNALLKTLEEPPPHVKFIFATTEIRKVPVTVLSRCQRFNLARLTTEALAAHLGRICKHEGAKVSSEGLALIARAAEGSARDALSVLDQAIVQASDTEVSEEAIRDMLGLADRTRVFDLLDAATSGQHKKALEETTSQLNEGAEAAVLVKDLLDVMAEIARAQALGDSYTFAGPAEWVQRTKALASSMTSAQSARYWKLLLQGFEDCSRAPDPSVAAEMVVLRLAAASALPSPEEAARMFQGGAPNGPAGGGPSGNQSSNMSGDSGSNTQSYHASGNVRGHGSSAQAHAQVRSTVAQIVPDIYAEAAPGPVLNSLNQICAALQNDREIQLLCDVEQFVRPATIKYGIFTYAAVAGIPKDFQLRLKTWIENKTGVEWNIDLGQSAKESLQEIRVREEKERIKEVSAIPLIADALKHLPGAKIVKIEKLDTDTKGNVLRVDFNRRRDFSKVEDE